MSKYNEQQGIISNEIFDMLPDLPPASYLTLAKYVLKMQAEAVRNVLDESSTITEIQLFYGLIPDTNEQ